MFILGTVGREKIKEIEEDSTDLIGRQFCEIK